MKFKVVDLIKIVHDRLLLCPFAPAKCEHLNFEDRCSRCLLKVAIDAINKSRASQ